ncbi:MAG: aminoglycoside phosphotransferase family protein [bacterium]|nr:aminoglycoside phosphotransferase family protein [bacterium]
MNKRQLLSKIRKEFPKLTWKTAQHNVEGWDHYIIILDDKYVFRFPRTKDYLKRLRYEILLLDYLKDKVDIPIPNYTFIAKDKSFAGYNMIKGDQLKKKIFKKLPVSTTNKISKQIAVFLTKLHKTSLDIARKYDVHSEDKQKSYKELVRDIKKYIYPTVSKKRQLLIEDFLNDLKDLKFSIRVFTHRDFYPHHILIKKNKKSIAGVIDFGDVKIDDPAIDFAELWVYGRKFVEQIYDYYKGPKDRKFLKRSILYYKRVPLGLLISRLQSKSGSIKLAHNMFKDIYLSKNAFK